MEILTSNLFIMTCEINLLKNKSQVVSDTDAFYGKFILKIAISLYQLCRYLKYITKEIFKRSNSANDSVFYFQKR